MDASPDKSLFLKAFNNQLEEFLDSLLLILNNNVDLIAFKNIISQARKANPKLIIQAWHKNVSLKYETQIKSGDVEFFLSKDYKKDVNKLENKGELVTTIENFKFLLKDIGVNNQQTSMKYIQNLLTLSQLYFN